MQICIKRSGLWAEAPRARAHAVAIPKNHLREQRSKSVGLVLQSTWLFLFPPPNAIQHRAGKPALPATTRNRRILAAAPLVLTCRRESLQPRARGLLGFPADRSFGPRLNRMDLRKLSDSETHTGTKTAPIWQASSHSGCSKEDRQTRPLFP